MEGKNNNLELGDQENLPVSEQESGDMDNSNKIEALMNSGHFESEQEAEMFLQEVGRSSEILKDKDALWDDYISGIEGELKEAKRQVEDIKKSAGGELVDENEVFKQVLSAIMNDEQEAMGETEKQEPSIISFVKTIAEHVKKNKKAFIAFSAFAALARMGSGEAEASEFNETRMAEYAGNYEEVDNVFEHQGEKNENIEEFPFDISIDDEPTENYKPLVDKIENLKDSPEAIYKSHKGVEDDPSLLEKVRGFFDKDYHSTTDYEFERGADFEQKIENLIENSQDKLQTVNVLSYNNIIGVEGSQLEEGEDSYEYNSIYENKTAVREVETETKNLGERMEFSAEAEDKETAVIEALYEAAAFKGADVESIRGDYKEGSGGDYYSSYCAERSQIGVDSNVTFDNVRVEEVEKKYNGQTHVVYKAKINTY